MIPSRSIGLAAGVALLLSSCAPKRAEVALSTESVSAATLVSLVEARAKQLKSIVGRGSVTFESPQMAGSAFFTLSLLKPDSLLVQLAGPFGMDLGTLFISRDRFVMYNSLQNLVTSGAPTHDALRAVIPFDLTYDQLMDAFTGGFGFPQGADTLRRYEIDGGRFHLTYASGDRTTDYWVDPEFLLVTKLQIRNSADDLIMEAVSSSVKEEDDACAPRKVTVSFPGEHRQLAVAFSELTLNARDVPFAYSIPSHARTSGEVH